MELLSTALSTLLGKVAVGTAVAAVSVAGMDAADLVDVPGFDEKPEAVVITDPPMEPGDVVGQTPAAEKADPQRGEQPDDVTETEAEAEDEAVTELEDETGAYDEHAEFGQSVADMAQDDETTGQDVAEYARADNPGADARQDAEVRQDDGAGQDGDAPQGGEVAEEARPEGAGDQAESRPEAPAAAAVNGRP